MVTPTIRSQTGFKLMILAIAFLIGYELPQPVSGLEVGRISVLYVGCYQRSAPFMFMRSDPLFSIQYVEASLRGSHVTSGGEVTGESPEIVVRRIVRLYMPRSYSDLTSRFDVMVFANANRDAVGPTNIEMLARGAGEGGIGLLMIGGAESFGGTNYPAWGDTAIGRLLPTEDVIGTWVEDGRLVIDRPDNDFIHSLPWDPSQPFMNSFHHNLVTVKLGAELLGHVEPVAFKFEDHPGMVTWQLENGPRAFAFMGDIMYAYDWDYCVDLGCNLLIYIDGLAVPQDYVLVHRVRSTMQHVAGRKSALRSLLDFCESFGANTRRLYDEIGEVDAVGAEAGTLYLELRFQDVLDRYEEVEEMLTKVERHAVVLKSTALAWVYVVEWLAVTGASLACGFVLWTFMVRRVLYRHVRTTRHGPV